MAVTKSLSPVRPDERIALLDVLRGFAILGILLVNNNLSALHVEALFPSTVDQLGQALIDVLGLWKFWPLFALLFGVGLAIQIERAETRGVNIIPLYLRRLLFLALFGFVLDSFIKVPYLLFLSIAGVSALIIGFLLRHRLRWVVFAALAVLMVWSVITQTARDLPGTGLSGPPDVSQAEVATRIEGFRTVIKQEETQAASWSLDRLIARIEGNLRWYRSQLLRHIIQTAGRADLLSFMLLGIFLWRIGVLRDAGRKRQFFLVLLVVALPVGLAAGVYTTRALHDAMLTSLGLGSYPTQLMRHLYFPMWAVASLGMSLAYVAIFALFNRGPLWTYLAHIFAPVGRMALTNYALQALFPALIFGSYTPGIPRTSLGVWPGVFVLLCLFVLQVVLSRAWLRSYRFGPLEWVWRSLTYWRREPMRKRGTEELGCAA